MKDCEKVIQALKICADNNFRCADCPYNDGNNGGCSNKMKLDACEILEEMKAQLEKQNTTCDYEAIAQSHSEEICKLHDKLAVAEIALERTQRELAEAERELKYLRAIKATTEAFLGVKIDGCM